MPVVRYKQRLLQLATIKKQNIERQVGDNIYLTGNFETTAYYIETGSTDIIWTVACNQYRENCNNTLLEGYTYHCCSTSARSLAILHGTPDCP